MRAGDAEHGIVFGLQLSVREWAIRQGWRGRQIDPKEAKGILAVALTMLARLQRSQAGFIVFFPLTHAAADLE